MWGRKSAEERRVTLYRFRIPGRKSQILRRSHMETWYKQQDLFEGNYKILRGRGYLAWLNADMSQALQISPHFLPFHLFLRRFSSRALVSAAKKKKSQATQKLSCVFVNCRRRASRAPALLKLKL